MTDSQFCLLLALHFYTLWSVERRGASRLAWYLAFLLAFASAINFYRAENQPTTWTIPGEYLSTPT